MRDQTGNILRLVVAALAVLVLAQLVRAGFRANALAWVKIPSVPTLETNSVSGTNSLAALKGSNLPPSKIQTTNLLKSMAMETNFSPGKMVKTNSTNLEAAAAIKTNSPAEKIILPATNDIFSPTNLTAGTNAPPSNAMQTNHAPDKIVTAGRTNAEVVTVLDMNSAAAKITTPVSTNVVLSATNLAAASTNLLAAMIAIKKGTNELAEAGTNKPPKNPRSGARPEMGMPGGFPGMAGMPGAAAKLPPEIQARVDKIVDSEIFAPVMRPLPMALLGIAGDSAFLRSANGQTGVAKVSESVGDIKLLRIGINRVLVETDGEKKELMIFDGYGGESLLPKQTENSK